MFLENLIAISQPMDNRSDFAESGGQWSTQLRDDGNPYNSILAAGLPSKSMRVEMRCTAWLLMSGR